MIPTGKRERGPRPTVSGLDRRRLGAPELTAQSVAVTAPTLSTASGPATVAAVTGGGAALSYLIATVVMLLVGYCVSQYTRRMVAAGSLYSYAAKGFGPRAAFLAGIGLIIGYGVLAMSTMLLAGAYLGRVLVRLGILPGVGTAGTAALAVLLALVTVGCGLRGITVTARTFLAIEVAAIAAVVMALVGMIVGGTGHLDLWQAVGPGYDWHGSVLGVVLALTSFVGFESASALSVEARRPQVSVARAIMRTVWVAGLLYLLASAVQPNITGAPDRPGSMDLPLVDLAGGLHRPWLTWMLEIGVAASAFACMSGSITALVRLLFSMGREGVLPRCLGRVKAARGAPHVALTVSAVFVIVVPLGMLLTGISVARASDELATLATFGYLLAYVVVCLSTPLFLHRIGELTPSTALAGPLAAAAMGTAFVLYSSPLVPQGHHGIVWLFLALVTAAMTWYLLIRTRRPELLDQVGVWDEPTASDLYNPADLVSEAR
ncbi:APC family permease [Streptomyces sp. NPDC101175]|uniref:APC family permease n=1 Tax=Streptomyces sp. NPDC101175 TaxID=3366123 RepID=UPI003834E8F8